MVDGNAFHHKGEDLVIAELRAGDVDAFRHIFTTYAPQLWRFARMSVPRDIAEDIVQDVFFDVWNRRTTLEIRSGLVGYLLGAVRHKVWHYLRHESVRQRTHDQNTSDGDLTGIGAPEPTPDEAMAANDLELALTSALQSLTELQRAVLTLRWTHEMTYDQIAETLQISVEAARQHVSRTQRVIRPLLEKFREPL